jgi:hypothetical protein
VIKRLRALKPQNVDVEHKNRKTLLEEREEASIATFLRRFNSANNIEPQRAFEADETVKTLSRLLEAITVHVSTPLAVEELAGAWLYAHACVTRYEEKKSGPNNTVERNGEIARAYIDKVCGVSIIF